MVGWKVCSLFSPSIENNTDLFTSKWGGFEDLGGIFTSELSITSWSANRLDFFGRGTDSAAYHKWYNGTAWNGYEDLGGILVGPITAVDWGYDRM